MTLDTNSKTEKVLTAVHQEYKILAEYKMIQSEDVGGVYVIPSRDNSLLWFGVIFVREGYFKDGAFRFNISLPDNFPSDKKPPTVIFQNEIFHPLICPYTCTLDISGAFPTWTEGSSHIWQVLKFIRFIFTNPQDCCETIENKLPNESAAYLLTQNKVEFILKAKQCVASSKEKIYDPPPTDDLHYIAFEKFDTDIHGPVLENLKKNGEICPSSPTNGLSWVKEGEFKPLGKE